MEKRKSNLQSASSKKKAKETSGRIPITAFFERIARTTKTTGVDQQDFYVDRPSNLVEIQDPPTPNTNATLRQSTIELEKVGTPTQQPKRRSRKLETLLHREIQGRTSHQEMQYIVRDILSKYGTMPAGLLSDIRRNDCITCLQFDADGVLLATGSSNGTIALYDFDEYFHRLILVSNQLSNQSNIPVSSKQQVHPIHVIQTSREIKRIRWNPFDQDEIACSFTTRNEIFLYNLKKFPREPYKIVKSQSRPSMGFYDLVYAKSRHNTLCLIAGDIDGSIFMWDLRAPKKPLWVISNNIEIGAINSLCLCANQQFLICGTEKSWILAYDILNLIVPAFGQRAAPKRELMYSLVPKLHGVASTSASTLLGGIMSIQLVPKSQATILCQLQNDWIVVLDVMKEKVIKIHSVLREQFTRNLPSDATTYSNNENLPDWSTDILQSRLEPLHLKLHRCMGAFMFDGRIFSTGFTSDKNLYAIDMETLSVKGSSQTSGNQSNSLHTLRRLGIPMEHAVTAVATHPFSNLIVCGMQSNLLSVVGTHIHPTEG